MRFCIGLVVAIFLLVTAAGAANVCGFCVFSNVSPRNDCPPCVFGNNTGEGWCPPCVFSNTTTRTGCPACVFSSPAPPDGCRVSEFSIHVEGDGRVTSQVSGGQARITVVYRSPQAPLMVPEGFSRGYMGYDPAQLPSGSPTFGKPGDLSGYPGARTGFERLAAIFPASSGFSRSLR